MKFSLFPATARYLRIDRRYEDEELKVGGGEEGSSPVHTTVRLNLSWLVALVVLLVGSNVAMNAVFLPYFSSSIKVQCASTDLAATCVRPNIRREWRTLTKPEKYEYISAVKCLATKASKVAGNGTRYDDFPWVHQLTASQAHKSAPFLPWHRYFIHSYESALKDECGFEGSLPYWNWSQDFEDFERSPLWDVEDGFGGDGDAASAATVGHGRCVTNGPFANSQALYYKANYQPHCLSRGFLKGHEAKEVGELVRPEAIDALMAEDDFDKFASELERRAHHSVRHSIGGDFWAYTGPYDPVFFPHHSNIDRLWDQWQVINPQHRKNAYAGHANSLSLEQAALTDELDVGGLLPRLSVSDVMDTRSALFCYRY